MGQPYPKSIQVLAAISIFIVSVYPAAGYDWAGNPGDGSPENPYQISEPNQLPAINTIDTSGKYFVLMNDIDLDPNLPGNCIFDSAIIAPDPFPPFSGVFDGGGHAIKNMRIEAEIDPAFLGLFGEIGPEGIVRYLYITDYAIRVPVGGYGHRYVGSLAGHNLGVIMNCFSSGSAGPIIEGEYFENKIGGLVGLNGGNYSTNYDYRGLIANSGSHSTLTVLYGGGGLVGENSASIYQCYSQGHVSQGELHSVGGTGGLIGYNNGVVNRCYSDSFVDTDLCGGLIGSNAGIVRNSFASGVITGNIQYGYGAGLVGTNTSYLENRFARIEDCYAACQIGEYAIGLTGTDYENCGATLSSFWDAELSGTMLSYGGKGLTTAQMKDPNTFIHAGWDFAGETANGAEDIWQVDPNVNDGYPSLVMKPIDGGDGSSENPYILYTKQQLLDFFNESAMWDKHIKLIANIDLSGMVFPAAPVGTFTGVLDGSGCTIYGLTVTCTSSGFAGLIEVIGRSGQVKNLFIQNASLSGIEGGILAVLNLGQISDCHVEGALEDGETLGGLVCANDGKIYRCWADCSVTSSIYGGGLAAYNSFFGTIRESCSSGSIGGVNTTGGLVGQNYGKIEHCYTSASVTGSYCVGSLAGNNAFGVIVCCYATGSPETLVGCDGGIVAHSYYGGVLNLQAWEGNSWYEEDGHIWTLHFEYDDQPLLKWQRWGRPVNPENIPGYWTPEYRQDPARDGSAEHPYRFSPECRDFPADWDRHFVMTENLDMGMIGYPSDEAVIPYFNGTVNAGGHVIKNLFLENQDDFRNMGFFGVLGPDATVKQLGIEGEIAYYAQYPALFAGVNYGTLEACYARGSVVCRTYGGILTGANLGTIRSCYAEGTLTLQSNHPYDEIVGGGLYARSWGRVMNSYASVETLHSGELLYSGVGGLNESLVWNSFWNNDLTEPNFILGGKPLTDAQMKDPNSFVGWGDDIWKIAPGQDRPRLAWENTDWTPESGIPPEEWPEYIPIADAPRTYGGGNGTAQSPYVLTSAEHLFTLGKHISDCDKHFILDNDIDLSGQTLSESVIGYFNGYFNGRGYLINGLTINGYYHPIPYYGSYTSDVGLFGCIDTDGWVEKLGLINTDLYGMCQAGSVAGENHGTIRQCYAGGYVRSSGAVGGIAGMNGYYRPYHPNTRILESYSEVSVYGDGYGQLYTQRFLGGIAGGNMGLVQTCYSTNIYQTDPPPMTYEHITGGIVGYSPGGMVLDCFYRQNGAMATPLGTELTNTQMKQKASFAGWDFADDGSDGPNNIWWMCIDGVDYPRLSWEFGQAGDFACPDGVSMDDLEAMALHWLTSDSEPDFNYAADGSGDGRIDLKEMWILSKNWGNL